MTADENNGNDDGRRKQWNWQRQTKTMALMTADENNGIDDGRRKQWY